MIDTQGKLLDAAERLFATQGFGAVSLRQIIAEAEVNVAAVHYHFGSKQELLDQVVMRKAGPVNEERTARLERIEAESKGKPDLERVLEAFLTPMAEAAGQHPEFLKMMGRMHAEGILSEVIARNFIPVMGRFRGLLRRALPDLPEDEFQWRVHFMQGALAQTMCGNWGLARGPVEEEGFPARMERLVRFLGGAFRAPVKQPEKQGRQSGKSK